MLEHQAKLEDRASAESRLGVAGDRYMVDLLSATIEDGTLTSIWCAFRHSRFGFYTRVERPK